MLMHNATRRTCSDCECRFVYRSLLIREMVKSAEFNDKLNSLILSNNLILLSYLIVLGDQKLKYLFQFLYDT